MKVRHLLLASLLLTGVGHAFDLIDSGVAHAADQAPSRDPLPFNDCMRTDRITDWHVVDDRTVTVANGPEHFVIRTDVACPRMGLGGGVHFSTAESNKAIGGFRICGDVTEKVVRRDDPPCAIQSVEKIDKASYDAMSKRAKMGGSGAGTSGSKP